MTEESTDKITVKISAKRKKSLREMVNSVLRGNNKNVISMRAVCKMPDSTESIIDTSVIIKKEYIEVSRSETTGEYDTDDIFLKMNELIERQ